MNLLGVRIDNFSKKEILKKIECFLSNRKFNQIATINPEFILTAQKDIYFKKILNECDLNIADGIGLKLAFWRFGKKLKIRFAGADLMMKILHLANEKKLSIFLVANNQGLSDWKETAKNISKLYPNMNINGINLNPHFFIENKNYMFKIADSEIVFCNFGVPYQEKFLYSLKSLKNSKIRLVIGVGGSFDYLTGRCRRAPIFMRKIGMEWFWRLIQQPKRFKRTFNSIVIFLIRIIIAK